jgi:hypothetical protein
MPEETPDKAAEIVTGNSPETIQETPEFTYNWSEVRHGKAPGGLTARYEIRIVTGLEGKRAAARQAEAVAGLLEWVKADRQRHAEARDIRSRSSAMPAEQAQPLPFAFIGRTSTVELQDPVASLRKQVRQSESKLPPGGFLAAFFWDIESGGLDLDARGHGSAHELFPDIGIPRDGGIADLLTEAASTTPRFVAVIAQNIERSARDMFSALQLEKRLQRADIPLFASDEPISMDGLNATGLLLRRTKQSIAEFVRLHTKEDSRLGLEQHTIDGYNIGPAPYGYLADKIRHPNPLKATQGKTKTLLILDPARAPAVEAIFYWRTVGKLGTRAIRDRLNTDHGQYPPTSPHGWTDDTVYMILRNPKYTGYMVYGRRHKVHGKVRAVPRDKWIWSPQPTHPAIVSREIWETAQTTGAEHGTSRDGTTLNTHRQTLRTYRFRSRLRCEDCQRRMQAYAPRPKDIYYACHHDPSNPKHAQASPSHPARVSLREDHLSAVVDEFCAGYLFSPTGRTQLTKTIPAAATRHQERLDKQAARLRKRLAKIAAEQTAYAQEIAALATKYSTDDPAVTALRETNLTLFTSLEADKTTLTQQLANLTTQRAPDQDPTLLQQLPTIDAATLTRAPAQQLAELYQALSLQLTYNKTAHQITIKATLTGTTPADLATWHTNLTSNPTTPPSKRPSQKHLSERPPVHTGLQDHEVGP